MAAPLNHARPAPATPRYPAQTPPAPREAHVAAFACGETQRIARAAGFPLAVIAATGDPAGHAARLSATEHAGWSPSDVGSASPAVFDCPTARKDLAYRQIPFDPRWLGASPLPPGMRLEGGSLRVRLPSGASAGDLDAILRGALAELSYEAMARRPDQVRYRLATGRPSVVEPRYALASPGDAGRLVAVDDLFRFRSGDLVDVARALSRAVDVLAIGSRWGAPSSTTEAGGRTRSGLVAMRAAGDRQPRRSPRRLSGA